MNDYLSTRPNQPHVWEEGSIPPPGSREDSPGNMNASVQAVMAWPHLGSPANKPTLRRQLLVLAFLTLFSVSTYYAVSQFIITAVMVRGRSMTPTLQDGERYFLNRWLLLFREPRRGDVVVIRDKGHDDFAVKRIVAMPSEMIELKSGQVFINGRRLEESYLAPGTLTYSPDTGNMRMQLGADNYFVMGDNRGNSEDSRYYGMLTPDQIIGVLVK